MQAVDYARPSSIEETVDLLRSGGKSARVLAGGTDLIVLARERKINVDLLVDVKALDALTAITYTPDDGLTIGAATPCYRITDNQNVQRDYPCLLDCTTLIGGVAIQGRASLGGNLCNSSPAADSIPALITLGTKVKIAGIKGTRVVPVEKFCIGPGQNLLEPGEFVVSLQIPPPKNHSGAAFQRFIPRGEMDIAVTNAAAHIEINNNQITNARIAIGAVGPTPLLVENAAAALINKPLSEKTIAEAVTAARDAAKPIEDMRGTIKQRRHLAGVMTERSIRLAAKRAGINL